MSLQLINTGIDGLDRLLGGGIPKGSTVLVSGPPGAGKTVIALEYTFKRAKKGERVLFVSTCELLYNINRFASSMSFFDLGLVKIGINLDYYGPKEEGGFVEFWDYSLGPAMDEQFAGDIFDVIQEKVSLHKIDHLIIDSISAINMFMGDEVEKRKKLLLFMGWASRSGCTTILTTDTVSGTEQSLTDGILNLGRESVEMRTIDVSKLKGQRHMSGRYLYTIDQDGMHVLLPGLGERAPDDAVSTGIADLDANIGGMAPGSSWHFNVSDAGADKILKDELEHIKTSVKVTFSGRSDDAAIQEKAKLSADGVIDVWNSGGYVLLQVKKAPFAQSFEPFIMKLHDGKIRLIPL
jgi:circadian clock protein KaiC